MGKGSVSMKILTLNMNSHARDFRREKLEQTIHFLAEYMQKYQIDLAALQECGQTSVAGIWERQISGRYHDGGSGIALKEDNAACLLAEVLSGMGENYDWTWAGVKQGYGMYDEGVAVFSRHPIRETDFFTVSRQDDFDNWKTRKVLGVSVRVGGKLYWFYDVHLGWWKDEEEPSAEQMQRLREHVLTANACGCAYPGGPKDVRGDFKAIAGGRKGGRKSIPCSCKIDYRLPEGDDTQSQEEAGIILLGDFNSPADVPGEGYDHMRSLGWQDTFALAEQKDDGITVPGAIDGWREDKVEGMRIDYIWTWQPMEVLSSRIVFSGKTEPVISDHFGVAVEIREPSEPYGTEKE